MTADLFGTNARAVLSLMAARRDGARDHASDRRKLALIVEGGGMRGVLTAGSLLAVDVMGYRACFDEVYATSAGAVNAAYFLSGQGELGITVYFDSINNRRFYNPLRLTKIVDVEFVYDYIVAKVKPLDEAAIRTGRPDLFFSVTDVQTGSNVLLDVKRQAAPIALMLKASSALPVLYNRTVRIGERDYVDGGLTCTIPVLQAAERGCTDVLILLSRAHDYQTAMPSRQDRAILYALMGRRYPALMRAYAMLPETANRDRAIATGSIQLPGVNVATICPSSAELVVDRTTIHRERLVTGATLMAQKTARIFGDNPARLEALFTGYRNTPVESP
jgi:predicted patatin/cPLA2 family phospholipase